MPINPLLAAGATLGAVAVLTHTGKPTVEDAKPGMPSPNGGKPGNFYFVDVNHGDAGISDTAVAPWDKVVAAPGFVGAILKASQGATTASDWFQRNWSAVRDAGGPRAGQDWFRGAYHFIEIGADPIRQANNYWNAVKRAGGWDAGDIVPIVDVEGMGEAPTPATATSPAKRGSVNYGFGKEAVISCVSAFVAAVRKLSGRPMMIYGGSVFGDLGIRDKMGCDRLWNPAWTSHMPLRAPWDLDTTVLWQYRGDDKSAADKSAWTGGPAGVPGFGSGNVDCSVVVNGAKACTLADVKTRLLL